MQKRLLCVVFVLCCGCASQIKIPAQDADSIASFETLIDVTTGDNRFILASYGGPVELLRRDCIKGYGLDFFLINRHARKTVWRDGCGEADYDMTVDYSKLDRGILQVTQHTWDVRSELEDDVPLWRITITVGDNGSCTQTTEILLAAEAGDEARIEALRSQATKAFESGGDSAFDDYATALCHLRNIAINQPGPVLQAFDHIPSDGHFSCIKSDFQEEVETLQHIHEENP